MRLSSRLAERQDAKNTPGIVLPKVKEMMLAESVQPHGHRTHIVYPSELSHQSTFCPRAVYLRITEGGLPPEKFDFVRENIFAEGNSIHAKWQERLRKATNLWGDWQCVICGHREKNCLEPEGYDYVSPMRVRASKPCDFRTGDHNGDDDKGNHIWQYIEVTLDAVDEVLIGGHADGAFDTTLVELKSVGEGTVRIEDPDRFREAGGDLKELWRGITRPFKSHLAQGDIYLWICQLRGLPFDKISFVYESKWNQQVKEFTVEYDEARSVKLIDQARAVKYSVDKQEEPPCRFFGTCKQCEPYDARRDALKEQIVRA